MPSQHFMNSRDPVLPPAPACSIYNTSHRYGHFEAPRDFCLQGAGRPRPRALGVPGGGFALDDTYHFGGHSHSLHG